MEKVRGWVGKHFHTDRGRGRDGGIPEWKSGKGITFEMQTKEICNKKVKKKFDLLSHQENANQNNTEITPVIKAKIKNSYDKHMLVNMVRNGNTHVLLV